MTAEWTNPLPEGCESHIKFMEWAIGNYTQWQKLRNDKTTTDVSTRNIHTAAYYSKTTSELEKYIKGLSEGDWLSKIDALLLLTKFNVEEYEKEAREAHFYAAVEVAKEHSGGNLEEPYWKEIVDIYLSEVNPSFGKILSGANESVMEILCSENTEQFQQLIRTIVEVAILPKSRNILLERETKRIQEQEREFAEKQKVQDCINKNPFSNEILGKLEGLLGYQLQVTISSEESGETILQQTYNQSSNPDRKNENEVEYTATISIFDKPRRYSIAINRIGNALQPLEDHHLTNIIKPMMAHFIIQKEGELLRYAYGNKNELASLEKEMRAPNSNNNYRSFIADVVRKCVKPLEFHESRENPSEYIDDVLKALDICRIVTSGSEDIPQEINHIMGGDIKRDVLDKAKSMLMSRDETIGGSGYPSGLSKKFIPLEGRIYQIIRVYEVLSRDKIGPKGAREKMKEWGDQGEYFDRDILGVFLDKLDSNSLLPAIDKGQDIVPDPENSELQYYEQFSKQCSELLSIIKLIGDRYSAGRSSEKGPGEREDLFKGADNLQGKLHAIADMMIKILVKRHSEAPTDVKRIQGESLYITDWEKSIERLTEAGEINSRETGTLLQREILEIFAGVLIRVWQATTITCKTARNCKFDITPIQLLDGSYTIPACESCPAVSLDVALSNPPKGIAGRGLSFEIRKFSDKDLIVLLYELVMKIISSPKEATNLIVTHGDTAVYFINCLETLFNQNESHTKKIPIGNKDLIELTVRGGKLLSEEEEKTRGLLFSVKNRDSVLSQINTISECVFGEIFFDPDRRTRLKSLHNRLLDFIDLKKKYDHRGLTVFLDQLERNPITAYLIPIIKTNVILLFGKNI